MTTKTFYFRIVGAVEASDRSAALQFLQDILAEQAGTIKTFMVDRLAPVP